MSEERLVEEASSVTELLLVQKMLLALVKFDASHPEAEKELTNCVQFCKQTLTKLSRFQSLFDTNPHQQQQSLKTSKLLQFNVGKLKNKKSQQKVQKLKDFTQNSYSYMQVVLLQSRIKSQKTP